MSLLTVKNKLFKPQDSLPSLEMTQSRLISIVVVTFFIKIMEDADEFLVVCLSEAEIFTSSLQ